MKKTTSIRYLWMSIPVALIIIACNLGLSLRAPTETPAALAAATAPPLETAAPPFQGEIPGELPGKRADHAGDMNTSPNAHKQMVTGGDIFVDGLYERPFNSGTMDTYFPYVDIIDVQGFLDSAWGYATITLAGNDPNGGLPAQYGVELDLDRDGRGDWLILASGPASTEWSTVGVRAWKNSDADIGGVAVMSADKKPRGGNGFEALVFDEGRGALQDGAWVRLDDTDSTTLEIAFKLEMLGNPKSYAMAAWAGSAVDPAMFDYHDHMTHLQAGSPNPGYQVYPLRDMAEIDNTCRLAVGFAPTGKEPGLCATVERPQPEGPGAPPPPTEEIIIPF